MTRGGPIGPEGLEEVEWLFSFGWSAERVADRLDYPRASLVRAAMRAGRDDLVKRLAPGKDDGGVTVNRADVWGPNAGYKPRKKKAS